MKRVERRGTLESQQQQNANQSSQQQQQQQQQQQLPSASHPNLPLSQGSDRFIHRSDTVLTQPPLNPYPLQSQPLVRSRGTRSSSLTQSNIRSSLPSINPSSSAAQVPITKHQHTQPPQSPPPSIAALKEGQDEDNNNQGRIGVGERVLNNPNKSSAGRAT